MLLGAAPYGQSIYGGEEVTSGVQFALANVLTLSAPTAAVAASIDISAGLATLAMTNPTITASQTYPLSTTAIITLSASTIHVSQTQPLNDAALLTISGPTTSTGIILNVLVDTVVVTTTAPAQTIEQGLPVNTNVITSSASAITVSQVIPITQVSLLIINEPVFPNRVFRLQTEQKIEFVAGAIELINQGILFDTASVSLNAPTFLFGQTIPLADTALITVSAPISTVPQDVLAGNQTVSITAPNPIVHLFTQTTSVVISLTAPSITVTQTVPLTTNILAVTGIGRNQTPGSDAGWLLVHLTIPVATNSIVLAAPTVRVLLVIPVATNSLVLNANAFLTHRTVPLTTGTIIFTAGNITASVFVPVASATVTVSAAASTVSQKIPVGSVTINITGATVTVSYAIPVGSNNISINAGAITVSHRIPVTTVPITLTASTIGAVHTTVPLTVNTIQVSPGVISVSQQVPVTTGNISISAPLAVGIATTNAPVIQFIAPAARGGLGFTVTVALTVTAGPVRIQQQSAAAVITITPIDFITASTAPAGPNPMADTWVVPRNLHDWHVPFVPVEWKVLN